MYPVLPFGPITIPTGPLVVLVALTVGLEVAGRYGRRLQLSTDDVWNTGLLWVLVSVIVARLWNVIQFWDVYVTEPWLILSLRPSGFVWGVGLPVGIVAAYLYWWRRALSPLLMSVALAGGTIATAALVEVGAFLTGSVLGLPSTLLWALPYYGVMRHPVALYYAIGLVLLAWGGWFVVSRMAPGRLLLCWMLGVGLLFLWLGAYEEGNRTVISLRTNQLLGLLVALVACLGLARRPAKEVALTLPEPIVTEPEPSG